MINPKIIMRSCCVCHRIQSGERWVQPPARAKLAVLLSHTYCPECFGRAMAAIKLPATVDRPEVLALA